GGSTPAAHPRSEPEPPVDPAGPSNLDTSFAMARSMLRISRRGIFVRSMREHEGRGRFGAHSPHFVTPQISCGVCGVWADHRVQSCWLAGLRGLGRLASGPAPDRVATVPCRAGAHTPHFVTCVSRGDYGDYGGV